MNDGGRRIAMTLVILLAFVLQTAFVQHLMFRSIRPNVVLTTLLVECLFAGPNTGAVLGFFVGLLEASYSAIYVGSFIVTRALAGYIVGSLEDRIFRDSAAIAFATALFGTVAVEATFFVFVPQPHFSRWAIRIGGEAIYNALIAIPVYLGIRRILAKFPTK